MLGAKWPNTATGIFLDLASPDQIRTLFPSLNAIKVQTKLLFCCSLFVRNPTLNLLRQSEQTLFLFVIYYYAFDYYL